MAWIMPWIIILSLFYLTDFELPFTHLIYDFTFLVI